VNRLQILNARLLSGDHENDRSPAAVLSPLRSGERADWHLIHFATLRTRMHGGDTSKQVLTVSLDRATVAETTYGFFLPVITTPAGGFWQL